MHTSSRPGLLLLDGDGSHITMEFCQYALAHNIHIMCLPAHSTHLLQPLDVGIFGPLQHYYGKAADTHMRDTRTGIKKGTFWTFYRYARVNTFLPKTIASAFRATGVHPFNLDKVLTMITLVKNLKFSRPRAADVANCPQAIFSTPGNRRQLRQQALAALQFAKPSPSARSSLSSSEREVYLAVVLWLSDLAEQALTVAELAKIETQQLHEGYRGKKMAKANKRLISKARLITGADVIRIRNERQAKDAQTAVRAEKKKPRLKGVAGGSQGEKAPTDASLA